jgi:hypothetical protein
VDDKIVKEVLGNITSIIDRAWRIQECSSSQQQYKVHFTILMIGTMNNKNTTLIGQV